MATETHEYLIIIPNPIITHRANGLTTNRCEEILITLPILAGTGSVRSVVFLHKHVEDGLEIMLFVLVEVGWFEIVRLVVKVDLLRVGGVWIARRILLDKDGRWRWRLDCGSGTTVGR